MNVTESQFCSACGAELGLEPIVDDSDLTCPICPTRRLDAFRAEDGVVHDCRGCGGQFVEMSVLRALIRRHESFDGALPQRLTRYNPLNDPVRYRKCPRCRRHMNRRNFGRVSGIVVDTCAEHGTWFDVGELPRVLSFVGAGGLRQAAQLRAKEIEQQRPQPTVWHSGAFERPRAMTSWGLEPTLADLADELKSFVLWVRSQLSGR